MTTKPTKPDPKEPLTNAVIARNRVTGPGSADLTSEQVDELMAKIDTPELPTVHQALNEVMRTVKAVTKDQRIDPAARMGTWKFRGIDDVVNAVGPALREHGVIVTPRKVLKYKLRMVDVGKDRKATPTTRVKVLYRWYGPGGDHIDTESPGESFDSGDKGTAKAMSVAFRINMIQTLCLPTDEPDPDLDVYERSDDTAGRVHGQDPEDQGTGQPVPPRNQWREWLDKWLDRAIAEPDPVAALAKLLTYAENHNAPAQVIGAIDAELGRRRDPGPLPEPAQPERAVADRQAVDVPVNPVEEDVSRGTRGWWEKHGKPVTEVDQKVQQEAAQFTTRLNKVLAQVGGPNTSVLDAMYSEAVRKCDEHPESEWGAVLGRIIDEYQTRQIDGGPEPRP